ncbi:MAG: precorrin-8X methylmutase [Pseudomonadota bacterium]
MRPYERDPAAIYEKSFATVRAEARLDRFPEPLTPMVLRLIHACGMVDVADRVAFSARAMEAGQMALQTGAPILCDCEMVRAGIIQRVLPCNNEVIVTLNRPEVPERAREMATTRSAAGVDLWRDHLEGAVVAIGNAPTALFRLLELLDEGAPRPAVILGFPVGFVGAAESKAELSGNPRECEFVTLRGRRGGSAMASAAVNALAAGLGGGVK